MRAIRVRAGLASVALILALAAPASADGLTGKPGTVTCLPTPGAQPRPVCASMYAKLDKLLAARDWGGLGVALSYSGDPDGFAASIDWLSEQVNSGRGGFFLITFLARDLWTVGASNVALNANPANDTRLTGAMMSLYALSVIQIDGLECTDRSSPGARMDQLIQQRREAFQFLGSQPPEVRKHVVATVVAMDRKLGPLRAHNDENLCNYGMEAMMAGMQAGRTKEVPNPGGYVGKVVDVSPPQTWTPKFRPAGDYEPDKAKARVGLQDGLTTFVEAAAKAKPAH